MSSVSEFVEEPRFSADFMPDFLQPMGELRRATIVIAEDDPEIRLALERILSYEGYRTISVNDGAAALQAVGEHSPDALLTRIKKSQDLQATLFQLAGEPPIELARRNHPPNRSHRRLLS